MIGKLNKRGMIQFLICCLGGNIGYGVYMLRNTFYDAFIEGYGISNTQFGTLVSIYASVAMFTYFIGGIICDKVSARKMVTISWIVNGVCTMFLSTYPSYPILVVVYAIMGLCATFTFWSPYNKVIRQMGKNVGGEGKAFGGTEGGRAFAEMILGTLIVIAASNMVSAVAGLRMGLIVCGAVLLACGIGAWFAFSDENEEEESGEKYTVKSIVACLKNPNVWILALIVLGCYAVSGTLGGYTSTIATQGFGAGATIAAFVGMCNSYFKPIGSIGGGFLSDRFGYAKTLGIGAFGMGVTALIVALMPKNSSMLVMFVVIYAVMIIFVGAVRGNFYTPLSEANVPMLYTGTAIGIIATIGYLPDVFMSIICGHFLDTYEEVTALTYILFMLAAFAFAAFAVALIFIHKNRKTIEENRRKRLEKKQ